jgi:serine/threonine-protein kinase
MRDLIGRTLGHYRIVDKIGEGGMGEVYRAHDERLDREVAVKVLPERVAGVQDRLERFQREAKLLASLNHQNIATLHGLEEEEGHGLLVMELVEGESLASVIARGPIPFDDALEIALQIAQALEAAHERGIVHRDLKPANIMVDSEGQVKVLDFGLAKVFDRETASPMSEESLAESPTLTADLTGGGMLLGTAAYMSPEQARGKPVDKRTDIWAFGAVFWEMLTGRRPFLGGNVSDIVAAILKEDPEWVDLPQPTPENIRRLLQRCLQKDARSRIHDIADVRIEIEDVLSGDERALTWQPTSSSKAILNRFMPWLLVLVLACALVVSVVIPREPRPRFDHQITRLSLNLPDEIPLSPPAATPLGTGRPSFAFSPDGSRLAYSAFSDGMSQLCVREMHSGDVNCIAGTEGAHSPFFSPDGEWVGFFSRNELRKVSISGGTPEVLCGATLGHGGTWGADDTVYFTTDYESGIYAVPAAGGQPKTIADPRIDGRNYCFPHALPNERGVLSGIGANRGLAVLDMVTGETRVLTEDGSMPYYSPTGHIVFNGRGTIFAVPFDLDRLELTGVPEKLIDGVRTEGSGGGQYACSAIGTLIFASGQDAFMGSLVWVDRSGRVQPLGAPQGVYHQFRISPDGTLVAIPIAGVDGLDIWLYDTERRTTVRLTFDGSSNNPLWAPDGQFLFFTSRRSGKRNIYRVKADASQEAELLLDLEVIRGPYSISSDGSLLFFGRPGADAKGDVWVLPLETKDPSPAPSSDPIPFLETPHTEILASVSPDGRWVAYTSDETGGWEVYVRPYPGPGAKVRVSPDGGEEPMWLPNGQALIYRFGSQWFEVDVTLSDTFEASQPRLLFEGSFLNVTNYSYDISPEGDRFLLVEDPGHTKAIAELTVITNWFEELKRLVPIN